MSVEQQNSGRESASNGGPLLVSALRAAELLSISQRTLFALTKSNIVPHRRLSNRVLYSPAELREWIARGCKVGKVDATPHRESEDG